MRHEVTPIKVGDSVIDLIRVDGKYWISVSSLMRALPITSGFKKFFSEIYYDTKSFKKFRLKKAHYSAPMWFTNERGLHRMRVVLEVKDKATQCKNLQRIEKEYLKMQKAVHATPMLLKLYEHTFTCLLINNKHYFYGPAVAKKLGYKDSDQAIKYFVKPEDQKEARVRLTYKPSNVKQLVINMSGFYSLLVNSPIEKDKDKEIKAIYSELLKENK